MAAPSSERAGVRQAIRALKADGWEISHVDDGGDEPVIVSGEREAIEAIEAVGFAHLWVKRPGDDGWVFFTMQNGAPDEVVCDFTTNLECIERLTNSWY